MTRLDLFEVVLLAFALRFAFALVVRAMSEQLRRRKHDRELEEEVQLVHQIASEVPTWAVRQAQELVEELELEDPSWADTLRVARRLASVAGHCPRVDCGRVQRLEQEAPRG